MQLLRLAVSGVDSTELTVGITQENQEVTGGALLHLIYDLVFLGFIDFASKAAAGERVVNDELVGFETGFLK